VTRSGGRSRSRPWPPVTDLAHAAAVRLEAEDWPWPVLAHRRWIDPGPGAAVLVLSAGDDWSATRTTAELPILKAMIYPAPSEEQEDAEEIALAAGDQVRSVLHRVAGGVDHWADLRILSSLHVGSGLAEVEGQDGWRVRTLIFEVQVL
jgi:hypothetical protein